MFTWRMLKRFIDRKVSKHGDSWLDNKLFIECVDPKNINSGFQTEEDSDGWIYSEIMHHDYHGQEEPYTTTFKDKGIVSININY